MQAILTARAEEGAAEPVTSHDQSAASWGAILAGAFVAMAVSLVLLSLGAGFEFSSVSPRTDHGISETTFSVTTAIWLIVTQWISACLGGYITGRLRTRWTGTHVHEVFFRDTAHGFVTWALATVVVAGIAASSITSVIGGSSRAAAQVAVGGASGMMATANSPAASYNVDKLLRSSGDAPASAADTRAEADHILANAISKGSIADTDRTYLASLIAQKGGASPEAARKRVDEFVTSINDAKTKAKEAADAARKVAAETAIYTALSMLIGAFIASVSAALGGRLRDEHI
jgi:putative Mn2+ efflux pump MntP